MGEKEEPRIGGGILFKDSKVSGRDREGFYLKKKMQNQIKPKFPKAAL